MKGFRKNAPKDWQAHEVFESITADYIKKIDDKSKIGIEVLIFFNIGWLRFKEQ